MWALSYYLTQLSLGPKAVASRIPDSRDQMWQGRPHPTEGALGKAPMEWTPRPLVEHLKEQERHNVTVITVGSKYEVYVRSPANPWTTLSKPCNKVRGKNIVKEVFLRLYPASFLPVSSSCVFLCASLLLSRYDTAYEYITFLLIWCRD